MYIIVMNHSNWELLPTVFWCNNEMVWVLLLINVFISTIFYLDILSCELKERCRLFNVIGNAIRRLIVLIVAFVFVYWIQRLFLVEFDGKNIIITKVGQEICFSSFSSIYNSKWNIYIFLVLGFLSWYKALGVFFLGFTYSQFVVALKTIVPFSIWVGALSLGFVIFQSLFRFDVLAAVSITLAIVIFTVKWAKFKVIETSVNMITKTPSQESTNLDAIYICKHLKDTT